MTFICNFQLDLYIMGSLPTRGLKCLIFSFLRCGNQGKRMFEFGNSTQKRGKCLNGWVQSTLTLKLKMWEFLKTKQVIGKRVPP